MNNKKYYFTFKGILDRIKKEYHYYTFRPWTLINVGEFWDSVGDYDGVNSNIYPYYRRFENSYELAIKYLTKKKYNMLDIQARSGNGSLFWHKKNKINSVVCIDFSDYFVSIINKKLNKTELEYKCIKISEFPVPINDSSFDFICTYETIEHIYDYNLFLKELYRLLENKGIVILTCPSVSWEWVHWLSAIININHSEGPHRFIRRKKLIKAITTNGFNILEENATILLPFNNKLSIFFDKLLEKTLPNFITRALCLRRTFVLSK